MYQIPFYKAEQEAGIADLVKASASVAYCQRVLPVSIEDRQQLTKAAADYLSQFQREVQAEGLYPVQSILVSTTWNLNDDIFIPAEAWAARHTPIDRPTNLDHDENIIVGHITGNLAITTEGTIIPEDTAVEDLPALFHLLNNSVIYTAYSDNKRIELVANLIQEIEDGKRAVSMEALFKNFDYGIIDKVGNKTIVPRNEASAFLTKHLRAYGGRGEYEGAKIGRVLRGITFIGKGFVLSPANPASIILLDDIKFDFSTKGNFNEVFKDSGVSLLQNDVVKNKENEMTVEELTKQVEDLTKANNELKVELEKSVSEVANKNTELSTVKAEKEAVEKELTAMKTETLKANRVSTLVDGGVDKEVATKKVVAFMNLTDDQFKELAEDLIDAAKMKKEKEKMADDEKVECEEEKDTVEATEEDLEKVESSKKVTTPTVESQDTSKLEKARASLAEAFANSFAANSKKKTK